MTAPALRCSTCGQELEPRDPPPNRDLEPLLSAHCRFCRQAADWASFHDARVYRGGPKFEHWQLVLLSQWLRSWWPHARPEAHDDPAPDVSWIEFQR